jgi:hypothetical protein
VGIELPLATYIVPTLRITGIIPPKFITPFHSEQDSLYLNPLNSELNPICHLLALVGAHPIFQVNRIRVNQKAKL